MLKKEEYFKNTNSNNYKELFLKDDIIAICNDKEKFINEMISKNINRKVSNGEKNTFKNNFVIIDGDVILGKNVKIDSFCKIEGPVFIGDNVEISTNVYIRPYTIIGDNVKVGHGSEIKNAIIMDNVKIASNVFVGDSVIGKRARIGSGTILANRRFDQKEIKIKTCDKEIKTGFEFFGSIIGDNSRLGANVTLLPGAIVGHDTFVMPGVILHGVFESDILIDNLKDERLLIRKKDRIELK